jgi:heptosyltransferase-2
MNILIIRLSSIGDILLTTPFIRQVRQKFPQAKIHFIIKRQYQDLIRFNSHINRIHVYEKDSDNKQMKNIIAELRGINFEYIFDLHNNLRSKYLCSVITSENKFRINKSKLQQIALVLFKMNLYKKIKPIPERYLDAGKPAGVIDDGRGLEIFWDNETEQVVYEVFRDKQIALDRGNIAIAPGAGYYTKRWPVEYFKQLIEKIRKKYDHNLLVLGGEKETDFGEFLGDKENVYNLTGQLTLLETAVLLSKTQLIVCNDTGLMHLATAVGTPVVAIFGSSVEELGFFPYRGENVVIQNTGLSCRPCSHVGKQKCPLGHFRCMKEIEAGMVFSAVENYIAAHHG